MLLLKCHLFEVAKGGNESQKKVSEPQREVNAPQKEVVPQDEAHVEEGNKVSRSKYLHRNKETRHLFFSIEKAHGIGKDTDACAWVSEYMPEVFCHNGKPVTPQTLAT